MSSLKTDISVVTTMYYSAAYIEEFYQRVKKSICDMGLSYEIIFVNDGSPDESLSIAQRLAEQDCCIKVVELSRNFGHHAAVLAGLSQVLGSRTFLIDVDLEEEPEWLNYFWEKMGEQKVDVVYGKQIKRKGNIFKCYSGAIFYYFFNRISDTKIPYNLCTVRLMEKEYVDALLTLKDKNIFLAGNFAWTGFTHFPVEVNKKSKVGSTYNFSRMFGLFINAITSFSSYPLKLAFWLGMIITFFSGIIGIYTLIRKLIYPQEILSGYTSIIISIWFLGGIIIFFLGIAGIYISKIFSEVKERPQYIIKKIWG